jgi:hypothetical protein
MLAATQECAVGCRRAKKKQIANTTREMNVII